MELHNLIQEHASEAEDEQSNETLSVLKNIYERTRCRQQYCDEIPDMEIPEVSNCVMEQYTSEASSYRVF